MNREDELVDNLVKHLRGIESTIHSVQVQLTQFRGWLKRLIQAEPALAAKIAENEQMQKFLNEKGKDDATVRDSIPPTSQG